jgi:hypothetical protein
MSLAAFLYLALSQTSPVPVDNQSLFGGTQVLGDWEVGCDQLNQCSAISLFNEGGTDGDTAGDNELTLALSRSYGPNQQPTFGLRATIRADALSEVTSIAIDGRVILPITMSFQDQTIVSGPRALRLARAMARGKVIALVDQRGKERASASLNGYRAVARFVDQQQVRVGTDSALVDIGRKLSNWRTIPPLAPSKNIRTHQPSHVTPRTATTAQLTELVQQSPCGQAQSPDFKPSTEYAQLDDRWTLLILGVGCGGYNEEKLLFVINDQGQIKPAPFGPHPFQSDEGTNFMPNVYWDGKANQLNSTGKTRNLGDCGQSIDFVWSIEHRFEVVNYKSLSACRGRYDYITTYRREVIIIPALGVPVRPMPH